MRRTTRTRVRAYAFALVCSVIMTAACVQEVAQIAPQANNFGQPNTETPLVDGQQPANSDSSQGKSGPFIKASTDLALLYQEFEACQVQACAQFKPSNSSLKLLGNRVLVDCVASDNPETLEKSLTGLGMQHVSRYGLFVSGFFPIEALPELDELPGLQYARPSIPTTAPR